MVYAYLILSSGISRTFLKDNFIILNSSPAPFLGSLTHLGDHLTREVHQIPEDLDFQEVRHLLGDHCYLLGMGRTRRGRRRGRGGMEERIEAN